jgi:uncharacterized protein YceK
VRRLIPALLLAAGLGGCGTYFNLGGGRCCSSGDATIYGGIPYDAAWIGSMSPFGILFGLIDAPFCLVADTLTLPWTISAAIRRPARDPFEADREKMTRPKRREE